MLLCLGSPVVVGVAVGGGGDERGTWGYSVVRIGDPQTAQGLRETEVPIHSCETGAAVMVRGK